MPEKLKGRVDVINFIGEITAQTASRLIDITEQIRVANSSQICLNISSGGGCFSAAFAAYYILWATGIPRITHNIGDIKNEAFVLYLAADTRRAEGHTQFFMEGVPRGYEFDRFRDLLNYQTKGKIYLRPNESLTFDRDAAIKSELVNDQTLTVNLPFEAVYWNVSSACAHS